MLARGLTVGLGTIALVAGVLAVFGDGPGSSRGVAGARNAEAISRIETGPGATIGSTAPGGSTTTVGAQAGAPAGPPTTGAPNGSASAAAPALDPAAPAPAAGGGAVAPSVPAPAAPPTTATAPTLHPSVTVAPGGGGVMVVSLSGFMPGATYSVTCKRIDGGVFVFGTDTVTTDGAGAASSTACVNPSTPLGSHEFAEVSGPGVPWVGSNHYQF